MPDASSLQVGFQSLWPLFLLPLALGFAWWGYRNTTPALASGERVPFVILRTLAFLALLVVLASPVLNRKRNEPRRAHIAVLVDASASMSTPDVPAASGLGTRAAAARQAVQTIADELGDSDVHLEIVPFDVRANAPLTPDAYFGAAAEASGAGTDVLGALRESIDRLAGENLQALVLVSDGRPTRGGLDADAFAALGRPVYALGVGDTLAARDVAIDRCDYAPVAYVDSETRVLVRVESSGFRGHTTQMRLLDGEQVLFSRELRFDQDHGREQVEIPLELKEPGRRSLRLVVDALDDEVTERNNAREIRIEVLKNKLRVLFVAALPDWDVGFLTRTFRDDPNVDVTLVHQNEQRQWIRSDDAQPIQMPPPPSEMREFDFFVLGAAGAQPPAALYAAIVQAVELGRGLLVLGGRHSVFGSQSAFAALASALPVQRARMQAPLYRVRDVRLTPQGRLHPATAPLADIADTDAVLQGVPPLLGRHADLRAKPGALTLLVTDTPQPRPVLVLGRFGNGHTAVVTGFPVWRWGFTENELVRNANTQFVGHLVRWLTQPRDVDRVQVTTSKPVYQGGEPVEFLAQVLDPQFEPLEDAEVRLEVRPQNDPDGVAATLLLERRAGKPGEYGGQLPGLGPGEYSAEAVAVQTGAEVGRDTTLFTVETYSVEFVNTSQNVDLLRELASRTGGRYATPAQAADVARELPRNPQPVLLHSEIEIWNTMPLFVVFVVLLSAEWLLRKRRGLL